MRIDKLLSNMGEGSRQEIKKLIKSGAVSIDGETIYKPDIQVNESQNIFIGSRKILYKKYIYIMMNKPQNVVSATEDNKDKTVIDILDEKNSKFCPFPVGRLDKDTEGLLILTNDGELCHNLLSPKKHIPKTYYANIDGKVTDYDINLFSEGIILNDGYKTLPSTLKIINSSDISAIELTIVEGKFHQVKRMFEAVNKKVIFLKRIAMGNLKLDSTLAIGEYRHLTDNELNLLKIRK